MSRRVRVAEHFLVAVLCIALAISVGSHTQKNAEDITATNAARTLVTAAHLGDIDGYVRVFVDEETDYAVYVKQDYIAADLVAGDRVSLVGTMATVSSVSPTEFAVNVDNISKIVPGVSGQPVFLDNHPVGFISGWDGAGALRCIFY